MVVKNGFAVPMSFQFWETQMIDRLSFRVIHTAASRMYDDTSLGALRYKRLAWCL